MGPETFVSKTKGSIRNILVFLLSGMKHFLHNKENTPTVYAPLLGDHMTISFSGSTSSTSESSATFSGTVTIETAETNVETPITRKGRG